jgi:NAD(P)-dependent dehydrogenase (short-subunit alcohol dehydrogenase family)
VRVAGPFDLGGQVALVTGGNSGIGLGMAKALTEAGADVAIWGTNEQKNIAAADMLSSLHRGKAQAFRCDIGDEAQVADAFAATLEMFSKVDSCFANAGVGGVPSGIAQLTLDEWHRVLRVNLDGSFFTLRAVANHMVERGEGGSLVVTSSLSSLEGQARSPHYAASKGALNALVRGLAVELARHRIRVNAIIPGWIETPMTDSVLSWETFERKVLPRVPLRRWGRPEDFGPIAVLLASPASEYLTGQTVCIDGGYSIF